MTMHEAFLKLVLHIIMPIEYRTPFTIVSYVITKFVIAEPLSQYVSKLIFIYVDLNSRKKIKSIIKSIDYFAGII